MSNRSPLVNLSRSDEAAIYSLHTPESIEIFLVSTPQMRTVLNTPEIVGSRFQSLFSDGLDAIVKGISGNVGTMLSELFSTDPIDILYILRGGLNFDLHRHISKISRVLPEVSFISSQRIPTGSGFSIDESSYRKWSLQDKSLLCIGDISATGTTIYSAINSAMDEYMRQSIRPKGLLIITVGTNRIMNVMKKPLSNGQTMLDVFEKVTIVYIESIFDLYASEEALPHHLAYTDFFRRESPGTVEFERESLLHPQVFIERCAIYDGGSRSFEPNTYLHGLRRYWESLAKSSDQTSLSDYARKKSNVMDYALSFSDWQRTRPWWAHEEIDQLLDLHRTGQKAVRWLNSTNLQEFSAVRLDNLGTPFEGRNIQNDQGD